MADNTHNYLLSSFNAIKTSKLHTAEDKKEILMAETIVHYLKDHYFPILVIAILIVAITYIALHYEQLFFRE